MTMMFGGSWEGPIVRQAAIFPVAPTYAACSRCRERFQEGDQGIILAHVGGEEPVGAEFLVGMFGSGGVLVGQHRECHIASIVGHLVGVCPCTGFTENSRAAAREATRLWDSQGEGRFVPSFHCGSKRPTGNDAEP